jgi:hypothetical protein
VQSSTADQFPWTPPPTQSPKDSNRLFRLIKISSSPCQVSAPVIALGEQAVVSPVFGSITNS